MRRPIRHIASLDKRASKAGRLAKRFPHLGKLDAPVYLLLDPFVGNLGMGVPLSRGQAMWFTDHLKRSGGFSKDDVCIISCAPPVSYDTWGLGSAINAHLKEHRPALLELLSIAKPKLVITFGAKATQQIVGRAVQITKARGQATTDPNVLDGTPVLPTLSPFYAQRQPENEAAFASDLNTARRIIDANYQIENATLEYKHDYSWCYDLDFLLKMEPKRLSVDIEGVGLKAYLPTTSLLTVQICWAEGKSVMVPIDYDRGALRHHEFIPWDTIDRPKLLRQLRALLTNPNIKVFGQNFKFDWLYLHYQLGIDVANYSDDTLLMAHLLDENSKRINLDDLVRRYVPTMAGFNDVHNLDPDHHGKSRMDLLPPSTLLDYGCGDTTATWLLRKALAARINKDKKLLQCYRKVSMPAQRAFCQVELAGFTVSRSKLKLFEVMLRKKQRAARLYLLRQIPKEIKDKHRNTGVGLKVTRGVILRDWLYTHPKGLKLKPVLYTKTKLPSISSKQALPYYVADHPVLAKLTDYIKNDKLLNTYVKGFYKYIQEGKVRPTYLLAATVTGRSACLHKDSIVTTSVGDKRAEDISVGDMLFTHKHRWQPVTKLFIKPAEDMFEVVLTNGKRIICTAGHRFYTTDHTWETLRNVCIKELISRQSYKGDSCARLHNLITASPPSGASEIPEHPIGVGIEEIHYRGSHRVFDFEVSCDHSYEAGGVFSHNSRDPNGQNFPKRGKLAKDYRAIFEAPPGFVYIQVDLSQAELRIAAMISQDQNMLQVYRDGGDIHRATAAGALGITVAEFLALPKDEQYLARYHAKCFSGDTEILTENGFVRFDELQTTLKVAQYNEGAISFVLPTAHHKYEQQPTVSLTDGSTDLQVTHNHRHLLFSRRTKRPYVRETAQLTAQDLSCTVSSAHAGYCPDAPNADKAITRLLVMVQAGGKYTNSGGIELAFSNPRKIARCRKILKAFNAEFTETIIYRGGERPPVVTFHLPTQSRATKVATQYMPHTVFSNKMLAVINKEAFLDELRQWSGANITRSNRTLCYYHSPKKECVDFAQVVCTLSGHTSNLRPYCQNSYRLTYRYAEQNQLKGNNWRVQDAGLQDVYSVTVPSSFIVVRRNGHVIVSGNSQNFGFIYGMWWPKYRSYAKTEYGIDLTDDEAKEIREAFFRTYPTLPQWYENAQNIALRTGQIRTYDGRIRHLPNVFSPDEGIAKSALRMAVNSPVQGIASDLGLMALGRLIPFLQKHGYNSWLKPCGFIHDAIVCLVREDKAARGCYLVKHYMENNPLYKWFRWQPEIPIIADAEIGRNLAKTYELPPEDFMPANVRSRSYSDLLGLQIARQEQELATLEDSIKIAALQKSIDSIKADAAQSLRSSSKPRRKRLII